MKPAAERPRLMLHRRPADLKQREPELGMLFADAATSDLHLGTSVPLVTRRQYWPLLLEGGGMAGFLMSSIEFATQRDAVAGAHPESRAWGSWWGAGAAAQVNLWALHWW